MLGYTVGKWQANGFKHLEIRFYNINSDGYTSIIGEITWQGDNESDHWYGFQVNSKATNHSNFEDFVKLSKKILTVYGYSPSAIIEWLTDMRGMKALVNDYRLDNKLVPIDDYLKSENLHSFEIFCDNQSYDLILAYDKDHARERIYKKWLKTYSNGARKIDKFVENGSIEKYRTTWENPEKISELIQL